VPRTSGRSRGRQGAHSGAQGAVGDHLPKVMGTMVAAIVVIVFVLVMTKAGRDIDAATQHFMLFYAGVFALIGLTGSVMVGLVATDRIVMTPGHRVMAQAVHRAVSFGALAFLVIHIVTEILAQRVHVIDAFIPFLSPFRTFYIGLGTIASDLILLIVITSILRKRFTAHGKAWRWRAIHYSAYAAFVFGVLHGLLGGRTAKPYVDWSYGAAIALTALGLAVRFLAISLRPKENLGAPPVADGSRTAGSSPLHAAAMSMAQAQLGGTVQVLPAGLAVAGTPGAAPWAALPAPSPWTSPSGPLPVLEPTPAYAVEPVYASAEAYRPADVYSPADAYRSDAGYRDLRFTPLGAPPYGDDVAAGQRNRPYANAEAPRSARPDPTQAAAPGRSSRQPLYEPGYDGPPRFTGAPRGHLPQDELSSYPYGSPAGHQPSATGPRNDTWQEPAGRTLPRVPRAIEAPSGQSVPPRQGERGAGQGDRNTGSFPRVASGPMPRLDTGPIPRAVNGQPPRPDTGPIPRVGTGPMPHADSGPMPRVGNGPVRRADTGPFPRVGPGPMPRPDTGPIPRVGSGPMPRADSGPMPRADSGPMPWPDTGPIPRFGSGPMPRPGTGPMPRPDTGPFPRAGAAPTARPNTGSFPRSDTGSFPRSDTGSFPRPDTGSFPRPDTGPFPRPDTGPLPRVGPGQPSRSTTGPMPRAGQGPAPRHDTGPFPRVGSGPMPRPGTGPMPRLGTGPMPRVSAGSAGPVEPVDPTSQALHHEDGPVPQPGTGPLTQLSPSGPAADPASGPRGARPPGAAGRPSHRKSSADPGYREVSGPNGGNEWR
jgi:DMSO/TMAO reductase YedYZ heme-binding membrane subunit